MSAVGADEVDRILDRLAEFGHSALGQTFDVETGDLGRIGERACNQPGLAIEAAGARHVDDGRPILTIPSPYEQGPDPESARGFGRAAEHFQGTRSR